MLTCTQKCSDCGNLDLVIFHGDLTCTQCGLVQISHMCEEEHIYSRNLDDFEFVKPKAQTNNGNDLVQPKLHAKLLAILEERFDFDYLFVTNVTQWFSVYTDSIRNTDSIRKRFCYKTVLPHFAGCIYCVSKYFHKGLTIDYIRLPLDLGKKDVLSSLPQLFHSWKGMPWFKDLSKTIPLHSDQISRIIYTLDFIPEKIVWDVVKTARKLYNKINGVTHCEVSGLKCHTFNSTCIYISLIICGFKMTRKEFCDKLCISLPTLKSQEHIVQNILHSQ